MYSEVVKEYCNTPYKRRGVCNAAKFLDSYQLPRGNTISVDEVRAGATAEGLVQLEELQPPTGPRIRDEFKVPDISEWPGLIEHQIETESRNRAFCSLTLHQRVGSGTSEGVSGAIMGTEEKQGFSSEKLNAYALYGKVNGGHDKGSSLTDNMAAADKFGIPTEKVWPRTKSWKEKLSEEAIADALLHRPVERFRVSDIEEYAAALFLGFLVYSGYKGHAWFGVDVLDSKRFLYKDSQGESYGDDGFVVLRWDRIYWPYGAWAIRTVRRPE